jgi:UDP-glucose 4-epimerase
MSKKVLLTGAFGNIGSLLIRELLSQGYNVVAFDKEGPVTRKNSRKFSGTGIRISWGDITIKQNVESALQGVDAVIHLAGIFPPLSENNPKLSQAVNVDGTRHLVEAMEKSPTAKRLIFASSIAVYGKQQGRIPPPLKASDAVSPGDFYGKHKAECEAIIQRSSLAWTLMRISACPPVNIANMASFKGAPIFESHPDSRVENVHPADAALAFVNAVACDAAIGKILLLGGGTASQVTLQQMFNIMTGEIGLGPLPREVFQIKEPVEFHGDWLDTEESQRLLKFQRYDIQQHYRDFWNSLGPARHALLLLKPIAPLVTWAITQSSPYYRQQKKHTQKPCEQA